MILPLQTSKAPDVKRFVDWAVTKGQSFGPKLLFLPLPRAVKQAARKNGGGRVDFLLACCYAQTGDSEISLQHLKKAIEEDQQHRILARHVESGFLVLEK